MTAKVERIPVCYLSPLIAAVTQLLTAERPSEHFDQCSGLGRLEIALEFHLACRLLLFHLQLAWHGLLAACLGSLQWPLLYLCSVVRR